MKQLTLPYIRVLLHGSRHQDYRLTDKAKETVWTIHNELRIFEPCGDDDQRSIWIEIPRGKISQWMTFSDAKKYDIATTKEEYVSEWKEWFPHETEWFRITTSVYEDNVFFHISNGNHDFAGYRGDNHGSYPAQSACESFEMLLHTIRSLKRRILKDIDAYNNYVEENLPKQIRIGRIPRKELYRILPWVRPDLGDIGKVIKMIQDCKTHSGTPLEKMSIRTFCKYYRIAYEVCRAIYMEEDEVETIKDDVEYYRKWHFQRIPDNLDYDSEEDFIKFKSDHYGELGFSRTDVFADNHTVPDKWIISVSINYSSRIWIGLKVALALYEAGAPLHIEDSDRLIAAVQETDYVRLTRQTFHNYLNHQNESSVFPLPWEDECDYEECGVSLEQLNEIINCSEWLPLQNLKIQNKIPIESHLYDLMRDEVREPMYLQEIRMKMWNDHDGYVGTYHYSEFIKNGYRPYLNGSEMQQVYDTWSEAITAGLLELIDRRRNNEND